MINPRPEYQEVGEHISHLLASEHCPQPLRGMLEGYLSDLYRQTNLLKPEIVRSLFPYLMSASESANGGGNDHDEIVLEESATEEANSASSVDGKATSFQMNGRDESVATIDANADILEPAPAEATY